MGGPAGVAALGAAGGAGLRAGVAAGGVGVTRAAGLAGSCGRASGTAGFGADAGIVCARCGVSVFGAPASLFAGDGLAVIDGDCVAGRAG